MKRIETIERTPRKWSYLVGLTIILASEFLLRDVSLPRNPSSSQVALATLIEWLVFVFLLAFWIPYVEGNGLHSIGIGRLKWKYLWWGVLVYFVLFLISIASEPVLTTVGLAGLTSLQPLLRQYSSWNC